MTRHSHGPHDRGHGHDHPSRLPSHPAPAHGHAPAHKPGTSAVPQDVKHRVAPGLRDTNPPPPVSPLETFHGTLVGAVQGRTIAGLGMAVLSWASFWLIVGIATWFFFAADEELGIMVGIGAICALVAFLGKTEETFGETHEGLKLLLHILVGAGMLFPGILFARLAYQHS